MSDTILITGVAKRLGYALAQHFLKRGHTVIGTYRRERAELRDLLAQGAKLYPVDFYQQEQVDAFIAAVCAEHHCLRAIIHNASDWLVDDGQSKLAETMMKMMQVHAVVPYQINLKFRALLEQDPNPYQDIIHISDDVTTKGSQKHIAYAASKAALDNMTLSFAALMGPKIKVNTLAPAILKFNPEDSPMYREKVLKKAIIQHEAGFEEMIRSVDYILQSEFVTGTRLVVNGGRHLQG
jgi:dihydromonapterin reductase/dihydrofolate reductase